MAGLVDLDDHRDSAVTLPRREVLAGVLAGQAVHDLQVVVGLVVDGIVGPLTLGALSSGQWGTVESIAQVGLPLRRRVTTDTVTTTLVTTTLEADVRWPHVVEGHFFDTPAINAGLDAMAHGWIDELAAAEPVSGAGSAHHLDGELEATLIAPSLVGAAGVLSRHLAGAAHPHPVLVTTTLDLAADASIATQDLFMPGTAWPARLRDIVLLTFAPSPGIAPDPANFQHLSVTPDGLRIHLYPEQVGLPLAAGVQRVNAPWARLEGEIRPSIPARALGHHPGGPGPHVP